MITNLKVYINKDNDFINPSKFTYKVYGESDNYTTPIFTTGNSENDENVITFSNFALLKNVNIGNETNIKFSTVNEVGTESEKSFAFSPIEEYDNFRIVIDTTVNPASKTANNQFELTGAIGEYNIEAFYESNGNSAGTFNNLVDQQIITLPQINTLYELRITPTGTIPLNTISFNTTGNTGDRGKFQKIISFGKNITWNSLGSFEAMTNLVSIESPIYNGQILTEVPVLPVNIKRLPNNFLDSCTNITNASFLMRNLTKLWFANPKLFNFCTQITDFRNIFLDTELDPYFLSALLINIEATNSNIDVEFTANLGKYYPDYQNYSMGSQKTTQEAIESLQSRGWFGNFGEPIVNQPSNTHYNVWFKLGQSNTSGRALFNSSNAPLYLNDGIVDNVKMYDYGKITDWDLSNNGLYGDGSDNSATQFSFDAIALKTLSDNGFNPLSIKYSIGGTTLSNVNGTSGSWNVDFDSVINSPLLKIFTEKFLAFKEYCNIYGFTYNIMGAIFHQGESDLADASTYLQDRKDLYAYLRMIAGDNSLPIFTATTYNVSNINEEINQSAFDDPNVWCYDATSESTLDGVHFDEKAMYNIGKWVAETYLNNYVKNKHHKENSKYGDAIENNNLTGTVQLDLATFDSMLGTLTGNVTLDATVLNPPPVGKSVAKNLFWSSTTNETITVPVSWNTKGAFVNDGSENVLTLHVANYATAGVKVTLFIN